MASQSSVNITTRTRNFLWDAVDVVTMFFRTLADPNVASLPIQQLQNGPPPAANPQPQAQGGFRLGGNPNPPRVHTIFGPR